MNDKNILPPLPPSDDFSLSNNVYDYNWKVRAKDFWGDARISRHEVQPFKNCDHYFIPKDQGAECQKCHIGYQGPFYKISGGKLFLREEKPAEE